MTTTPSTASQAPAVSIDTQEFLDLACKFADESSCEEFNEAEYNSARAALVAHIDAKLAQAREEAIGVLAIAFEKMLCAAVGRDWSPSGISASSLVEELRSLAEKANDRATAAEAKLEAMRQGVDALRWCYKSGEPRKEREAVWRDEVLALLQPQPQADREAEQRKRIQERFANRPKTPATADFDLPYASNSDGPEPTQADESGLPG